MTKYNVNFELSVEDMALIEDALRRKKQALSRKGLTEAEPSAEQSDDDDPVRKIHDLLGRLHNQKVFYRPRAAAYVGG